MATTKLEERIRRDMEAGDFGLARRRLASHLSSRGYDARLLSVLGRICFDMHDLSVAGKYWLASSAEGPDVDRAVAAYLLTCGGNAGDAAGRLPRFCRLPSFEAYPPEVQARLKSHGLESAVVLRPAPPGAPKSVRGRVRDALVMGIMWTILAFIVVSIVVGGISIFSWFGGFFRS